jgi:hypothetical protein
LLQRGIFLLSFGRMAGRRSGVHGGEQRVDSAMKSVQFLSEMFWRKKLLAARNFCGGSSEMTKLSWWR